MNILKLLLALLLPALACGQKFEVASVKAAAPCCAPGQWRESKVGPDRVDLRYVTMRYCLAQAYRLKEFQIAGPSWIGEVRFDIVAKGPEGATREQIPEMMQALLRDRFQLEVHREQKEYNVYALVVGKSGPKLTETPKEGLTTEGAAFGMSMNGNVGKLEAKHCDMLALANTLPRLVGRPVVDRTGISGRYDFDLEFSREDALSSAIVAGPAPPPGAEGSVSVFTSIQRLGLRLDAQKTPLDTIVVDRGEKTPIEN